MLNYTDNLNCSIVEYKLAYDGFLLRWNFFLLFRIVCSHLVSHLLLSFPHIKITVIIITDIIFMMWAGRVSSLGTGTRSSPAFRRTVRGRGGLWVWVCVPIMTLCHRRTGNIRRRTIAHFDQWFKARNALTTALWIKSTMRTYTKQACNASMQHEIYIIYIYKYKYI